MLMCLVNPPTEFARRSILAVLLDVAQETAAARDAAFASFRLSQEFTRCVHACECYCANAGGLDVP
jgi:hypothetical protein